MATTAEVLAGRAGSTRKAGPDRGAPISAEPVLIRDGLDRIARLDWRPAGRFGSAEVELGAVDRDRLDSRLAPADENLKPVPPPRTGWFAVGPESSHLGRSTELAFPLVDQLQR
jgi:hypothetical protein